jgi:hypothetical protein
MNKPDISRRSFLAKSIVGIAAAAPVAALAPSAAKNAFATHGEAIAEAMRLVEDEGCCRVVVSGCDIVSTERGRGTGPFLRLLDARPDVLRGAVVVDSVVGTASAAVAVKGGAAKVIARTASEGAKDVLARAGIPLEAEVVVPQILNRDMTGPCPLEAGVAGLTSANDIVASARRTLSDLRAAQYA